jgi:squalene-associated FAD-dependent desaturase
VTRAHVVGAGLAGLAAAIALTEKGYSVTISEAARHAGGRCRSYDDPQLGLRIDNGNHLVLSGNLAVARHLARIGASDRLTGPAEAAFPFVDLRNDMRWTLRPNAGAIPWWVLSRDRRVPGTKVVDYLSLAKLPKAAPDRTIADVIVASGALWDRLTAPLMVSALNTPPAEASAALAGAIVAETLAKGGRACRPLVATPDLSATFIDPAIAWLEARGAAFRFGRRLRGIAGTARISSLAFSDGDEPVASGEPVILAVPAWVAAELLPDLSVPTEHHAIVNGHFLLDPAMFRRSRQASPPPPETPPLTGLVGGTAEWLFAFPDRLSTTTSAADALCELDREELAQRLWADVAKVLRLPPALPRWQIVRERRATFAATPAQDRLRPPAATRLANLWLAGDWTQTRLPATIEGALRSGETAAREAMRI